MTAADPAAEAGTSPPRKRAQPGPDAALSTDHALPVVEASELTLVRYVGGGAFGRVHEARYRGRAVAVKQPTAAALAAPGDLDRWLRELTAEAQFLANCRHVHVSQLLGVCRCPHLPCLVMEFAHGGTLSRLLEDELLPPAVLMDWSQQLARGMNYLHEVHRIR